MDFKLELLDETTFQNLVNTICKKLLGIGVISYAKGKDGGKDGKFTGTAENYPSKSKPWIGKFIIQSKHTDNHMSSCSDSDFQRLIINTEVPKIKALKKANEIDCYLIFTNRKFSGVNGDKLLSLIKKKTKLENVDIIGKETINGHLNQNSEIVKQFSLDKHHIPFDFSDTEIKNIILSLKSQLKNLEGEIKENVEKLKYDYNYLEMNEKNKKNSLGKSYFEDVILSRSLQDFDKIQLFLGDPKNSEIKECYFDVAAELNEIITLKRDNFLAFEEIFNFIYKKVCDGNVQLEGMKRRVSTLFHYMYMECLIGVK